MAYTIEDEIKRRMKGLGLTVREIAGLLREPPGTTGNRLNGFLPLHFNQRRTILDHLSRLEERKAREESADWGTVQ